MTRQLLKSVSVWSGKQLSERPEDTVDQIKEKIDKSWEFWRTSEWRNSENLEQRAKNIARLAEVLRQFKDEAAQTASHEMGKPLEQVAKEVEKCASLCEYYSSEEALAHVRTRVISQAEQNVGSASKGAEVHECSPPLKARVAGMDKTVVAVRSLGPILGVMPWNFPLWQVFRWAVPLLLVGNTAILKHASIVQGCAELLQKIFLEAGFDKHCFTVLIASHGGLAEAVLHRAIAGISLTGSEPAGRDIAAKAGSALKKVVVELGGSDPHIVMQSTNLAKDEALAKLIADKLVTARIRVNTGQSCVGPKRVIVVGQDAASALEKEIVEQMKTLRYGVDFGPMCSQKARAGIEEQIKQATSADGGATVAFQLSAEEHNKLFNSEGKARGEAIEHGKNDFAFLPPTLLTNVDPVKHPDCAAWKEEIFGPVLSLTVATDDDHAFLLANDSRFGLAAAIYCAEDQVEQAENFALNRIDAGTVFINDFPKSDPRLPFGGVKASGIGRECGEWGLYEFANVKTIAVNRKIQ